VAAQLLRKDKSLEVIIIDPAEHHYYQPAWTLVGGGVFDVHRTVRKEATVIPQGATWLQKQVMTLLPEANKVITSDGQEVPYDFLVVAPGIQLNWSAIKGLPETLGKNGVCSNYSFN